jgi:hypothetical protein
VRIPVYAWPFIDAQLSRRYKLYASGSEEVFITNLVSNSPRQTTTQAFAQLYSEILESGGPAFREVFLHLKDRPGDPIMFNCTAGKDRTGILAALILKVSFASYHLPPDVNSIDAA